MTPPTWHGEERRNQDQVERDRLLTEIHTDLKNFLPQFSRLQSEFEAHTKEDREDFRKIWRFIWTASGVILAMEFISHIIWHQ